MSLGRQEVTHLHGRVTSTHLQRKAIVYLRQSSPEQVKQNRESTALQYGLRNRAFQLGWAWSNIEIIDEDLGRSAKNPNTRPGFETLTDKIELGKVGIVLCSELSRLSRNLKDWGALLDSCDDTSTLIADGESVYDLKRPNDRLLLGLRGNFSEVELHTMHQRMHAGREAKAARGELRFPLPRGYVYDSAGKIVLDPDESVQETVREVFRTFARTGSMSATVRSLVANGRQFPRRQAQGRDRAPGKLRWVRPSGGTVHWMLSSPIYAGAFAWGRIRGLASDVPLEERWRHLLKDHHPAYISWEEFELNQRTMARNHWPTRSRHGGLLTGLIRCGRCGQAMTVHYRDGGPGSMSYCCRGEWDYGKGKCQRLSSRNLEQLVSELALDALSEPAVDLSLDALAQAEADRSGQHRQWRLRLERAEQDVEAAERDWRSVDPHNRLVAQTLEAAWEATLVEQAKVRERYQWFCERTPPELSQDERDAIVRAAAGIRELWTSDGITLPEKAEILRLLIERVTVTVQGDSERVTVELHWHGGSQVKAETRRPVRRLEQLSNFDALKAQIEQLRAEGHTLSVIADVLNKEGWKSARRDTFTPNSLAAYFKRIRPDTPDTPNKQTSDLSRGRPYDQGTDEWLLDELAMELGIPKPTLYTWAQTGKLEARKSEETGNRRWLVRADAAVLDAIRQWRDRCPKRGGLETTPDFRVRPEA